MSESLKKLQDAANTTVITEFKMLAPPAPHTPQVPLHPNKEAIDHAMGILKEVEGFVPTPHKDVGLKGRINTGYGMRSSPDAKPVTESEAEHASRQHMMKDAAALEKFFTPEVWNRLTPAQRGGLLSATYNMGVAGMKGKQSIQMLKDGNVQGFIQEFSKNIYSKEGKPLEALIRRRVLELAPFMDAIEEGPNDMLGVPIRKPD